MIELKMRKLSKRTDWIIIGITLLFLFLLLYFMHNRESDSGAIARISAMVKLLRLLHSIQRLTVSFLILKSRLHSLRFRIIKFVLSRQNVRTSFVREQAGSAAQAKRRSVCQIELLSELKGRSRILTWLSDKEESIYEAKDKCLPADRLSAFICFVRCPHAAWKQWFRPLPALPPGVKLGLSNIAVMYCLFYMGKENAFILLVLKSLFVFLTARHDCFLHEFCRQNLFIFLSWFC